MLVNNKMHICIKYLHVNKEKLIVKIINLQIIIRIIYDINVDIFMLHFSMIISPINKTKLRVSIKMLHLEF